MSQPQKIAIDGPGASGKSTVGQLLAQKLAYLYFDTGVMYRAVTCLALQRDVDVHDEAAVTALAEAVQLQVRPPHIQDGRQNTILADGEDITWAIRHPDVDAHVSVVAAYPGVRSALTQKQRSVAEQGPVIMVGRDIGTVVLPNADLKIYLDATVEERARRRWAELQRRGEPADYEQVHAAMRERDDRDAEREVAPLRAAEDAIRVDTTGLSVDEVVERLWALLQSARTAGEP